MFPNFFQNFNPAFSFFGPQFPGFSGVNQTFAPGGNGFGFNSAFFPNASPTFIPNFTFNGFPAPSNIGPINPAAATNRNDGLTTIALLDDWFPKPDNNDPTGGLGFNHGMTMAGIAQGEGANRIIGYNTGFPNVDRIQQLTFAAQDINRRLDAGEDIDSVVIAQEARNLTPEVANLHVELQKIMAKGVPVVVASDNFRDGTPNALAPQGAIIVMASDRQNRFNPVSGPGNVMAEGRFTSQASAAVGAMAAQLEDFGLSNSQILGSLQQRAFNQGGSLDTRAYWNFFGGGPNQPFAVPFLANF
ncbi:MAG: hypothetical protein SFZ03_01550 [Candidatus Melainabacteria bacterium]|nr:hypothetical protein [Candidatus Melainabacteria bacterium]